MRLIILLLLASCGGTYTLEAEEIEVDGGTQHTVGPDFEAWRAYCKGKVTHESKTLALTAEELTSAIDECYYNLDLDLPELPEGA